MFYAYFFLPGGAGLGGGEPRVGGGGKELYHVKVTILEISGNKFSGA